MCILVVTKGLDYCAAATMPMRLLPEPYSSAGLPHAIPSCSLSQVSPSMLFYSSSIPIHSLETKAIFSLQLLSHAHLRLTNPDPEPRHAAHPVQRRRVNPQHRLAVKSLCCKIVGTPNGALHAALDGAKEETCGGTRGLEKRYFHGVGVDDAEDLADCFVSSCWRERLGHENSPSWNRASPPWRDRLSPPQLGRAGDQPQPVRPCHSGTTG